MSSGKPSQQSSLPCPPFARLCIMLPSHLSKSRSGSLACPSGTAVSGSWLLFVACCCAQPEKEIRGHPRSPSKPKRQPLRRRPQPLSLSLSSIVCLVLLTLSSSLTMVRGYTTQGMTPMGMRKIVRVPVVETGVSIFLKRLGHHIVQTMCPNLGRVFGGSFGR